MYMAMHIHDATICIHIDGQLAANFRPVFTVSGLQNKNKKKL